VALKLAKSLGILYRLKTKLPKSCLLTVYYSLIYPHLTYCNIVWGGAAKAIINELVVLQKRAIRIITNSNYRSNTTALFKELQILKLEDINMHCCRVFMSKFICKELPNASVLLLFCTTPLTLYINLDVSLCLLYPSLGPLFVKNAYLYAVPDIGSCYQP